MKTRSILFLLLSLLLLGLLLLAVSHSRGSDETHATLPLVVSGTALGDGLLHRLHVAAKTAGYLVEVADIRAQTGGIQIVLPGLVLIPPADHNQNVIRLPVVIKIGRAERLLVSFRAITRPTDPLPDGAAIRILLRQTIDGKVVADQTTKLVPGWNTPALVWVADSDRAVSEFAVDIVPVFVGPIKVTLPQGLLLPSIENRSDNSNVLQRHFAPSANM